MRRRLPVLSNDPPPPPGTGAGGSADPRDEDETRPPWHWAGFGTVAIFAAWLPLAYVAGAVSARVMAARFGADASREAIDLALAAMSSGERARLMATVALPSVLGLALAAFGGGVIVGRFGSGAQPARVAAVSGAMTALVASAIAWGGFTAATLVAAAVTFGVAVGFAAWGGRFGASRRPRPPGDPGAVSGEAEAGSGGG
ncbi:MAG: hypothetical protein KF894_21400 [Labilithrix sp.]|nr:hypothetical protein [Labilithrix sp.]